MGRSPMTAQRAAPRLSVVVPMLNEEGSVEELVRQVAESLGAAGDWELLLVDDGSTDATASIAMALRARDDRVHLIRLARRYGQSTAMQAGFDHARGEVVVTLDGDLQNDPADIPRLVDKLGEGYDLVVGYRMRRKDGLVLRKVPSWVANRIIRWITGVPIRDNGCSLKAYRRSLLDQVRLYSDMHRFIPALSVGIAGARVVEVPVNHRARLAGASKYGLSRIFRVLADLAVIKMIRSFRDRPLYLFAILAGWSWVVGALSAAGAFVAATSFSTSKAAAFVLPGVSLLWFALAGFLVFLGLVAEVGLRSNKVGEGLGRTTMREVDP